MPGQQLSCWRQGAMWCRPIVFSILGTCITHRLANVTCEHAAAFYRCDEIAVWHAGGAVQSISTSTMAIEYMRCNGCGQELERKSQCIATTCSHLFCERCGAIHLLYADAMHASCCCLAKQQYACALFIRAQTQAPHVQKE
jgi:hypothetical protein